MLKSVFHTLRGITGMFNQYFVYYDGQFKGTVMALSEQSAKDKGCQLVGVSASAYTGKARRLVEVVRR
jgi:hypothetical protein